MRVHVRRGFLREQMMTAIRNSMHKKHKAVAMAKQSRIFPVPKNGKIAFIKNPDVQPGHAWCH